MGLHFAISFFIVFSLLKLVLKNWIITMNIYVIVNEKQNVSNEKFRNYIVSMLIYRKPNKFMIYEKH